MNGSDWEELRQKRIRMIDRHIKLINSWFIFCGVVIVGYILLLIGAAWL